MSEDVFCCGYGRPGWRTNARSGRIERCGVCLRFRDDATAAEFARARLACEYCAAAFADAGPTAREPMSPALCVACFTRLFCRQEFRHD